MGDIAKYEEIAYRHLLRHACSSLSQNCFYYKSDPFLKPFGMVEHFGDWLGGWM